ncbi:hypothetical protein Poli38472_007349 [Pythium oligandrum]|uniref:Expansin-like EG45 domain-containing protein n=1 Tax=Pythium oligandrum TaxID=41045 RepID=A0A8K1FFP5_PYTOL|nr:hypothetical protein Poli38472_007349 [Pythium oligandrum]|eukprot:TMW59204.1 hypothetical protein Poli38472_007349 [Pythium oligandrum]
MMRPAIFASLASLAIFQVQAQSFQGDMTAYTLGQPSAGNCNFLTAPPAASQNYAALNAAQWGNTANCGRCAEVSCADDRCSDKTKTEIVYILDQCPECKQGDLDVSPSVFKSLTGSDPSRYTIKWRFVDCPVSGNIQYCLKSGSNPYWTAIQPANTAAGVKSLTIDGKTTSMVPSAYYYLLDDASTQRNYGSVRVTVTSLTGEVIEDTVSLSAGSCTEGNSQFSSGGSAPAPAPAPTPASTTTAPVPKTEEPTYAPTETPEVKTEAPEPAPAPVETYTPAPVATTSDPSTQAPTSAPAVTTSAPAATKTPALTTAPTAVPAASTPATVTPAVTTTPSPSANNTAGTDSDDEDEYDDDNDSDYATPVPTSTKKGKKKCDSAN